MQRFKIWAETHPIVFGLVITIAYILALIGATMLSAVWPGAAGSGFGSPGGMLGRILAIGLFLAVLYRFGWLRPAGFASPGSWRTWLVTLLLAVFAVLASAYALAGGLDFRSVFPTLTGPVILFILVAAFLEEVVFRGLVLHGFVRAWGGTGRGLVQGILAAALFFASIHLFDFLSGRPLPGVLMQSLAAIILGIFLGALVVGGSSIYPAFFFHGVLNLAGYLIIGNQGVEPSPSAWLLLGLLILPLAVFGVVLLGTRLTRPTSLSTAR
jgi:membrane protease YdiL (CAAX protease family)